MKSKNFLPRLGIMQGRLVPQESKKIQSFPEEVEKGISFM